MMNDILVKELIYEMFDKWDIKNAKRDRILYMLEYLINKFPKIKERLILILDDAKHPDKLLMSTGLNKILLDDYPDEMFEYLKHYQVKQFKKTNTTTQ